MSKYTTNGKKSLRKTMSRFIFSVRVLKGKYAEQYSTVDKVGHENVIAVMAGALGFSEY